jgi:hypothetical protein
MTSNARAARIDLTRNLPARPRPLTSETLSQVFGGCVGEWQMCNNNIDCCSQKCLYHLWIAKQNRYIWECLPTWAQGN